MRTGQRSLAAFFADGLKAELECECVFLGSGSIRCEREYGSGTMYSYADLMTSLPYGDELRFVIELPGSVIAATASESRQGWPETELGVSAQFDSRTIMDDNGTITHINGEAFDPERLYTVGVRRYVATKMPGIKDYTAQNPEVLPWASAQQL